MEQVSIWKSRGGAQGVYTHTSIACGTPMTFSVFVPEHEAGAKLPVLWYLSGLTCTHANVTEKGEYRRACADAGVIFVAPDTSPRGDDVPDYEGWELGKGAGFYIDATQAPWAANYQMRTYVEQELPQVIAANFPVDMDRQSIMGHSMGGHGALAVALRNPHRFRSASALAPIPGALNENVLAGYLGSDRSAWPAYDLCALIETGARPAALLVDLGDQDEFVDLGEFTGLATLCEKAGLDATFRLQPDYGHSYYFVSTFMEEHVAWHAQRLKASTGM
jgi:S-formylglutathione hydrolase